MRLAAIGCQSWVQYRRFLPRGRRPLFKRDLKGRLLGGQSGRQGRRCWKLLDIIEKVQRRFDLKKETGGWARVTVRRKMESETEKLD